jgi:transmembrane sensor
LSIVLYSVHLSGSPDFQTSTAEIRDVILPDGTRLALNARTSLDIKFDKNSRAVRLLDGEAFFDVSADPNRPFEVEVDNVRFRALGTAFNVRRFRASDDITLTVSEHAVEISPPGLTPDRAIIRQGWQATLVGSQIQSIVKVNMDSALAWRKGWLIVDGAPLPKVIEVLRAYHPGILVAFGSSLEDLKVSVAIDLRKPDLALDTLAAALPIKIRHLSPYLTIVSPN